jgi:hypothetical protein
MSSPAASEPPAVTLLPTAAVSAPSVGAVHPRDEGEDEQPEEKQAHKRQKQTDGAPAAAAATSIDTSQQQFTSGAQMHVRNLYRTQPPVRSSALELLARCVMHNLCADFMPSCLLRCCRIFCRWRNNMPTSVPSSASAVQAAVALPMAPLTGKILRHCSH